MLDSPAILTTEVCQSPNFFCQSWWRNHSCPILQSRISPVKSWLRNQPTPFRVSSGIYRHSSPESHVDSGNPRHFHREIGSTVCRRWSLVRGISGKRNTLTRKEFLLFAAIVVMNHEAVEDDHLLVLLLNVLQCSF